MAHRNYLPFPWNMEPGRTFELGKSAVEQQQGMGDNDPAAIQAALTVGALFIKSVMFPKCRNGNIKP